MNAEIQSLSRRGVSGEAGILVSEEKPKILPIETARTERGRLLLMGLCAYVCIYICVCVSVCLRVCPSRVERHMGHKLFNKFEYGGKWKLLKYRKVRTSKFLGCPRQ